MLRRPEGDQTQKPQKHRSPVEVHEVHKKGHLAHDGGAGSMIDFFPQVAVRSARTAINFARARYREKTSALRGALFFRRQLGVGS